MTHCLSDSLLGPSAAEVHVAHALLARLVERGNDPQLGADGLIRMGGPVTARELAWAQENREAVRAALVGSGRFVRGTLDLIYGLISSP